MLDWDEIHAVATHEQQRRSNDIPWSREARVGRAILTEIQRQLERHRQEDQ